MAKKKVNMRLIGNGQQPEKQKGNWYDCHTRLLQLYPCNSNEVKEVDTGVIAVSKGDMLISYLGFACDMGKGYEAQIKPRSSTFKKYGLIQGNSVGLIDDTYNGDNDEWMVVWHCTTNAIIPVKSRLCQITIEKSNPETEFNIVDTLGNEDRGGFGTTGN